MLKLVNLKSIQTIRKITKFGIFKCKEALRLANGDVKKAIQRLNKLDKMYINNITKKQVDEGYLYIYNPENNTDASLIKIKTESSFIIDNKYLTNFVIEISKVCYKKKIKSVAGLLCQKIHNSYDSIDVAKNKLISILGENIIVSTSEYIYEKNSYIGIYKHGRNAKTASVVFIGTQNTNLAKNIAMHVVAMKPNYLSKYNIKGRDIINKKKELFKNIKNTCYKTSNDISKKLHKNLALFLQKTVLLEQIFIKNKILINILLKEHNVYVKKIIVYNV